MIALLSTIASVAAAQQDDRGMPATPKARFLGILRG